MRRRNFLQLAAMTAVAVVLPKGEPKPEIEFPARSSPADHWQLAAGRDYGYFGEVGAHFQIGDTVTFYDRSGRAFGTHRIQDVRRP